MSKQDAYLVTAVTHAERVKAARELAEAYLEYQGELYVAKVHVHKSRELFDRLAKHDPR